MDEQNLKLQDAFDQIADVRGEVNNLSQNFYKNNFSSSQDFNKSSRFNTSLKVPVFTTLPTCEVGEICVSSGKLYVCSATDTWTIVGTQS